jgi:hypothetical protein
MGVRTINIGGFLQFVNAIREMFNKCATKGHMSKRTLFEAGDGADFYFDKVFNIFLKKLRL